MKIVLLVVVLLGFLLLHTIKLMRLYLIVFDKQLTFERFVPAYMRTTLVNLIVPFKLGEIYRIGVFYRISGGFATGFFSVLIDRFFDTFALVLILLPYQLLAEGRVSTPVILLAAFLISVVLVFTIFPSTFMFFNRYIIMSKTSHRSMAVLKGLEVLNDWYEYAKALVVGRYGILILFSIVAWMMEILVFAGFSKLYAKSFSTSAFSAYIDSILLGKSNELNQLYTICSIVIIAILTVASFVYYLVRSKNVNAKQGKDND